MRGIARVGGTKVKVKLSEVFGILFKNPAEYFKSCTAQTGVPVLTYQYNSCYELGKRQNLFLLPLITVNRRGMLLLLYSVLARNDTWYYFSIEDPKSRLMSCPLLLLCTSCHFAAQPKKKCMQSS